MSRVLLSESRYRVSEILFEIGAVHCNVEKPYIFTSGWASPVYVNCRKLVSRLLERREIIEILCSEMPNYIDIGNYNLIAGGETAGIPFAAWLSEKLSLPMIYVRKRRKQFGLEEQIEGEAHPGERVLLVEDLMTDGKSKVHFVESIRNSGMIADWSTVIFNYGVYPSLEANLAEANLSVFALTDWQTNLLVGEKLRYFSPHQAGCIRDYLTRPQEWSDAFKKNVVPQERGAI